MKTCLDYLLTRIYCILFAVTIWQNFSRDEENKSKFLSILKQAHKCILNVSTKLKIIKGYFLAIYRHSIQFVVVKLAEITHFPRGTAYRWSAWLSCSWIMCSLLFRCMIVSKTKALLSLSEMTAPPNR